MQQNQKGSFTPPGPLGFPLLVFDEQLKNREEKLKWDYCFYFHRGDS
jgi:hypothetical protein